VHLITLWVAWCYVSTAFMTLTCRLPECMEYWHALDVHLGANILCPVLISFLYSNVVMLAPMQLLLVMPGQYATACEREHVRLCV